MPSTCDGEIAWLFRHPHPDASVRALTQGRLSSTDIGGRRVWAGHCPTHSLNEARPSLTSGDGDHGDTQRRRRGNTRLLPSPPS